MKELPLEIWFTIMKDHVNSLKRLGECRLVCRAWDRIAESAMLGKELVIDATNATKFYNYLSSKSSKGNLIKHLVFNEQFDINQQRMDIVQLGFTPTIQSLIGFLGDHKDIKQLIDIVHASPVKFNNMKTLFSYVAQEDNFFELASLFKDTLQELSLEIFIYGLPLEPNATILLLDEFKQLKYLELDIWLTLAFCDWENLLQKCHHLTSLKIELEYEDEDGEESDDERSSVSRRRLQRSTWPIRNIQKFNSIQRLELVGATPPGLCLYFLHKFPNLQHIQLDLPFIESFFYEGLLSVLRELKSWESYHIEYSIRDKGVFNFATMFESAKKKPKSLTIVYDNVSSLFVTDYVFAKVDSQKATAAYKMILSKLSADSSFSVVNIGCASEFYSLVLNFAKLKITDQSLSKTQVFIQAISTFDQLNRIELSIDCIKEEDINSDQLPLHKKLTVMQITGAEIDANVFSTFDACFPALKSLILDQCHIIANTSNAANEIYPVDLPQGWLRTIAIVGLPASKRPTLLHLKLLSKASHLYFLLLPFHLRPLLLARDQFKNLSKDPSCIFSVTCQYVSNVKINQGDINLSLHVATFIK